MKKALLIIDMQKGLFDQPPFDFTWTINNIKRLHDLAEELHFPVIFIQHEKEASQLEYGSPGWCLIDALSPAAHNHLIRKTTPDSFLHTGLNRLLAEHDIGELIICGYATEYCIDTTVRSAAAHGYHVLLAADAHTTHDKDHMLGNSIRDHHNQTLSSIKSFNVLIQAENTASLLQRLSER